MLLFVALTVIFQQTARLWIWIEFGDSPPVDSSVVNVYIKANGCVVDMFSLGLSGY